MRTGGSLERDVLIVACGISAGIHAALAPDHFSEGTGAGAGFLGAAVLLAALAALLTRRPASAVLPGVAVTVLAGLLASYALAISSGVPVLHPEPEAVDGLAVFTKGIEAAGLVAATRLLTPRAKETLT